MERRNVKESNATREMAYGCMESLEITGHKLLGRVAEGLVFENEEGLCLVIKAIAKSPEFDGEFEVEDYEAKQAQKALDEAKRKEKGKKAKAKKDKEKEEKGE